MRQIAPGETRLEPLVRPIEQCVEMVFPTPIAMHLWPDSDAMNAELKAMILAEEARSPGLDRSNVGGWHSDTDFMSRAEPSIERLRGRALSMIGALTGKLMKPASHRFAIEGWANVLRRGQYNSIHLHPNSTWSGVYYVTGNPPPAEDDKDANANFSGKIEFIDPRPGASATYTVENALQRRSMLNPGPGAMVVFPSWLQHQVHPYFGPDVRISIAFNVLVA